MEDVKVCRICLVMDVKMYDLQSQPLFTYLESFTRRNLLNIVNSPPYACYECAGLMKKYYIFKQKCWKSQDILYGLIDQNGKITPSEIRQIDRDHLLLSSNLRVYAFPQLSIQNVYESQPIVKQEVYEGQPIVKQEVSDEELDTTIDVEFGTKEEIDFDIQSQGRSLSSDEDDEPLSFYKGKKIKECQDYGMEVPENEEVNEPAELLEEISNPMPVKRKRGRPKKIILKKEKKKKAYRRSAKSYDGYYHESLDPLEDCVTVINLTLEEQIAEINKRKNTSNYVDALYQCDLCYKGFVDTRAWKHHLSKHSPSEGDNECAVCKFRFKSIRILQRHTPYHEKRYACKFCPYVSSNETQAKHHVGWHKGVTYKCKHCDDIFTIWTSYMSHMRLKHPSEFICGFCGYSYISKLGLGKHQRMMHRDIMAKGEEIESGPYCEDCDVKFISMEAFKRHMVMSIKHIRSTDTITGCRTCGERFKTAEELTRHRRQQHHRKTPLNYKKLPHLTWPSKCEHCPEMIPNGREQWAHYRRAHPDEAYPLKKDHVCDICGKRFQLNAYLIYHKRTHTEERAFKCDQCDKAFFNRSNLRRHLKNHSDSRPYPCSDCSKAFKCKGALDRHFRSHTGQKPYECEECGKAFSQSNSRKLHIATVHLKQPVPMYGKRKRNKTVEKEPTQT